MPHISEQEYQRAADMGLLDDEPEEFDINQYDIMDDIEATRKERNSATSPSTVNVDQIQEQIASLEKEGKWIEAGRLKTQLLWERNAYVGKPDEPPAPTPASAPEPLTVDQLHAAIREAEAAGPQGAMRAIALKTQLLNLRGQ